MKNCFPSHDIYPILKLYHLLDFLFLSPKRHTYCIFACVFLNLFCKDPTEVLKTWNAITTLSHSYSPVSSLFPFLFFSRSATKKLFFLWYVDVILKIIEYTFVCFSIKKGKCSGKMPNNLTEFTSDNGSKHEDRRQF